jgi:hypothetical protein
LLTNRKPISEGIAAEDVPEEWARADLAAHLERAIWIFGLEPDSPFVRQLRRILAQPGDVKHCEQCGVEIAKPKFNQRFCGHRCANEWNRTRWKKEILKRFCEKCGCEFHTSTPRQKFCSYECSRPQSKSYTLTCRGCGEAFVARHPHQRWCDPTCRNKFKKESPA